jgi:hypothetical protein
MPVPNGPSPYSLSRSIFFPRPVKFDQIRNWIANPQKSIARLIGDPGSGKSWLLGYTQDYYTSGIPQAERFPVFWLDNPRKFVKLVGRETVLDEPLLKKRIEDWYTDAVTFYGTAIPPFIFGNQPSLSIRRLAEAIEKINRAGCKSLLLVDGIDEMADRDREIIFKNILLPFTSTNRNGWNVMTLIAERSSAAWMPLEMKPDKQDIRIDGNTLPLINDWQHFLLIYQHKFGSIPPVTFDDYVLWKYPLVSFQFDNPYINHYLFACGLVNAPRQGPMNMLTKAHVEDCIKNLLEHPSPAFPGQVMFPVLTPIYFNILVAIAHLNDPFAVEEIEPILIACDPGSGYNRFTHPFINNLLMIYGIISKSTQQDQSRKRYHLNPSIRALLRDYNHLP